MPPKWLWSITIIIAEAVAANNMKHGIKHYSFGQASRFVLVTLVTGIGIGLTVSLVASLFVAGLHFLTDHRQLMGADFALLQFAGGSLVPMLWLIVAAFLLWGVRRLFGIVRWHGPADSIFGAHRLDNEIDVRAGIGSNVGAFIAMGGGASVGQYGPLVHFGATIGTYIRQAFGNTTIGTDVFIGCGVAAAIAAGFHAPIAGIVFAHEAVLRHFSFRALTPIAISSITSVWFGTAIFGGEPLFVLDAAATDLLPMVPILLASGLLFGVIAMLFMLALFKSAEVAAKTGFPPLALALMAAVICGLVAIFVPEILGSGATEISIIFSGGYALGFLFLLFVLKLLATSLCIGFGLFGGVFSPAAMIGAAAGGFIGKLMATLGFATVPNLLPVAGFAAVTAAVVGAPISVVLVVFELTQSYEFAVAAMLAAVIATFFTSLVFGHSFFDEQLLRRGIDMSRGRGDFELQSQSIIHVVSDDFVALSPDAKTKDAIDSLVKAKMSEGYCIDANQQFIGKYALPELLSAPRQSGLAQYLVANPLVLDHDASILQAMEVASNFVGESIPVIQQENGRMVGIVSEADIFSAYLATQSRVHTLEHG
jgi:CIC family chloride channel protein